MSQNSSKSESGRDKRSSVMESRRLWRFGQGDSALSIVKRTDLRDGEAERIVASHSIIGGLSRWRSSLFTRRLLLELHTAITGAHMDLLVSKLKMEDVQQRVAEALRNGTLVVLDPQTELLELKDAAGGERVVPLKWAMPEYRPLVTCKIRIQRTNTKQSTGAGSDKTPGEPLKVVLKTSHGRLRFHEIPKGSTSAPPDSKPLESISLDIPPKTALEKESWAYFSVSGELPSKDVGDASIEVFLRNEQGGPQGKALKFSGLTPRPYAPFTVFWFDDVTINSVPGYAYHCMEEKDQKGTKTIRWVHTACESKRDSKGRAGITHEASVALKPSGVSCSTWQINHLYVGFIQNTTRSFREETYDRPEIVSWEKNVPPGVRDVEVAKQIVLTYRNDQQRNDTSDKGFYIKQAVETEEQKQLREQEEQARLSVPPLYQRPLKALYDNVYGAKENEISDHSLKPLLGCDGSGTAQAVDSPGSYMSPLLRDVFYQAPGSRKSEVKVATVRYYPKRCKIRMSFLVWVVVIKIREDHFVRLTAQNGHKVETQPDKNPEHFCVLRQRSWELNYDSDKAEIIEQRATAGEDAPPTMPVIEGPYANDLTNNEANWTEAKVGKVSLPRT